MVYDHFIIRVLFNMLKCRNCIAVFKPQYTGSNIEIYVYWRKIYNLFEQYTSIRNRL